MCHTPLLKKMGNFSPTATATTSMATAITVFNHLGSFPYFKSMPNATASIIKSMEVVATAPFAVTFINSPASFAVNPLKVPATTSAKAATTRIQNSQQKSRNSFFPIFPIYSSIMYPMVRPLFLTEAYIEAKS